ncbi:MAG: transcription termination factor NusA [Pirellulaceae bacterium]
MNPNELLRIVDSLHRDKNIDPEIVFQAIEAALVTAAKRQYGEESNIVVRITRENGAIDASCNGDPLDPEEMIGRIGAQTAKQVIIQKIREAERDALIDEYQEQIGQLVSGIIQRSEGGAATVTLGTLEAILPRSEQIPGESHHANERIRAVIFEVKPQGSRVKVVLSRTRPQLVQRLFEQEIPEIAEGVITVNAIAREPGYRSKVAVSSSDQRVDCVGACVGVRGNRIKNIVDELAGERIDIVRWSDDPEVLIPNALQPAEVDQVLLCDMIGRAIVLVREDQLSLAIGRRGQNVRLASKLCGWDIEIMTADELEEQIERAVGGFNILEGVNEELAQALVEQGYLSYDDLSVIEPDALMEMGGLTAEQVDRIVEQAEQRAEVAEQAAAAERRRQREQPVTDEGEAGTVVEAPEEETGSAAPPAVTEQAAAASHEGTPAPEDGMVTAAEDTSATDEGMPAPEELTSEVLSSSENSQEANPPAAPREGPGHGVDD